MLLHIQSSCSCFDALKSTLNLNEDVLVYDSDYGWYIILKDVEKIDNYIKINKYGLPIKFCPICGNLIQ